MIGKKQMNSQKGKKKGARNIDTHEYMNSFKEVIATNTIIVEFPKYYICNKNKTKII